MAVPPGLSWNQLLGNEHVQFQQILQQQQMPLRSTRAHRATVRSQTQRRWKPPQTIRSSRRRDLLPANQWPRNNDT